MEQSFDYGARSFKVVLTLTLELLVYDEEGKKLKSMPSPGKKDDPVKAKAASDSFKLLKKQLKTVAGNQKLRLEQTLCTERLWSVEQWKELSAWREQLSDYEVIQPIEQLERPVCKMTDDERNQKEMTRFGGMILNGLSLSGKLQGMGWNKGEVEDAGVYYTFFREDGDVVVELEFSGSYVGDENEEVTVYGVIFRRRGAASGKGNDNQYKLSEISPRFFSEIILQLTKATASSQERLSYPECRK